MTEFGSSEAGKLGAKARAKTLTKEERSAIARAAAIGRWGDNLPKATHGSEDRPLKLGNVEISCYVLEDGTRVLSQAGFLEALGRHRKARVRNPVGEDPVPAMIQGKSIKPFISDELREKTRPVVFRVPDGARAKGYRAEILPEVCEVYLRAREEGVLPPNQQHVAKQAEILMRALAHVGIIALVDEATGYQRDRARDELAKILEAFVAKEIQKYLKTFDLEFYELMCAVRNEPLDRAKKRPKYFGTLTNNLVYCRLAPGVLNSLKKLSPVNEDGRRKTKLFQGLTPDYGHPKLKEHLAGVTTAMKLAKIQGLGWDDFINLLDKTHPKFKPMPLFDNLEDEGGH